LASSWNRRRALGQASVALFAFRYDRALDLLQNIAPLVDGYISWDDTRNKELWYHAGSVRNGLIEAARSIASYRVDGIWGEKVRWTCSPSGGDRPSTVYRSTRRGTRAIPASSLVLEPIPSARDTSRPTATTTG
jgi:hypothetical protein